MHVGTSIFFQNHRHSRTDHEVYQNELRLADLAEPLGSTTENIAAFDANTLVDIITTTTPGRFNGPGHAPLSPIVTFQ